MNTKGHIVKLELKKACIRRIDKCFKFYSTFKIYLNVVCLALWTNVEDIFYNTNSSFKNILH